MVLLREHLESFVCKRFRNGPHCREWHIRVLAPAPGTKILGLHTPGMKKVDKEVLWQYIVKLLYSKEPWSVPFTEIDALGLRDGEPYYVRMGVTWLLETSPAKDEFLKTTASGWIETAKANGKLLQK